MARAQGARSQLAAAFESVYGTAPASGYFRMPFARSTLGTDQPLIENELLGYGRDPLPPVKDAITSDGAVTIPLDAEALGFWLKATFGAPSTSGSDPYTHVFTSGGWTLPSMAIEVGLPEIPQYKMFSGCMVDQMSWQMSRSGLLVAEVSLVAQGETPAGSTNAGTPTDYSLTRFGHFAGAISRNGSALGNVVSAQITYSNNLDRVETIRSDGKIDGADPTIAALTGSIDVRFADTTLVDQAIAGTACELSFAYTLPGGESFTLVAHEVYLPRPRQEVTGPQGVQATFNWQAALDSVEGQMCTATLVNSVASY